MEQENNEVKVEETTETPEVKVEETKVETNEPTEKQPTRNEILRELSKEHGVNLFDAEGLKQFKEYTESQKTEADKLQEQLSAYEEEKAQWQTEKLKYESQIKANELGVHPNNLEDVLKLADNDPNKIPDVVKKYPVFKSKEGIKIGVQDPSTHQEPTDKSEVEAYMERHYKNNPYYKK